MQSIIRLPKPHLSWSQIDLWNRNPKEYIERYFYGKDGFVNAAMEYGKKFANAVETGDAGEDELLKMATMVIPRYEVAEYRLEATLVTEAGAIPLLGYLDTSHYEPVDGFREYKTGKTPWTQKRVNYHGQITFYALMVYLRERKMPAQIHLDWLETDTFDGRVCLTGRIVSFETERTIGQVLEMATIIKRTAAQINAAYEEAFKSIL